MAHQVLARKWRPRHFQEIVGQPHVVRALSNALNQQYLHHAYLFTGTRGVGKTTIARIIAKCLNCETGITASPCDQCTNCQEIDSGRFPDLYEVDAASRTKVEDTRELLENVQYAPSKGRFKVYLIDEVHMLSGHSFNALLKTLEEPPSHVKFLLATTDYQKLPATVLSRCLQFHLTLMTPQQIANHLSTILEKENIKGEMAALELLGRAANGSMRDALSLLDQSIAYGNGSVLTEDVKTMLGTIEPTALFDILSALNNKDGNALLSSAEKLAIQGIDFSRALAELLSILHQITIIQAIPDAPLENHSSTLKTLATQMSPEDVQLFYEIGLLGQKDLSFSPTPRIGFEMTLLRMLAFYPESSSNKNVPPSIAKEPIKPPQTSQATAMPWHDLLSQLNLTGATLALAQQCSLKTRTDTEIVLLLNPKQKPLLQPQRIQQIQEAINNCLNRTVLLRFELGDHVSDTPLETQKRHKQDQQVAAEKTIMNDLDIQRIMKTFDATIIKESITPYEGDA